MAEFPNMRGYSFSFSQPYLPTSFNPFYERARDLELEREIDRLEAADRIVQNMLTYPDAERILNKIRQGE